MNEDNNSTATDEPVPYAERDFEEMLVHNLYHSHGRALHSATERDMYAALSLTVRDHLVERWRKTSEAHYEANAKFVYYLSAEFLLGKQLHQNLLYSGSGAAAREALAGRGHDLDKLAELDPEPGLGNGGLGRLAACFIDSLASLDIPAVGYGIRYEFGIFEQAFSDGWQIEKPDEWEQFGFPWEFPHPDDRVEIGFGGRTERYRDDAGRERVRWIPGDICEGEPCTVLVPGYGTQTVNMLRLWRARATNEFDFQLFDVGDYARAVSQKVMSENVSKVLYPNDSTPQGKELRLKQQYFFVACSLRDIIRRYRRRNEGWASFPDKVAIQLNDTHPVIAIPELMRILLDEEGLGWDEAWEISRKTFAYTCHTLLPEALETWPVGMMGALLPRHLEIIYGINDAFLRIIDERYPGDIDRVSRMSLIEEGGGRHVRMANLATVGSHAVNGVAELQSRLLREQTLHYFAGLWPHQFQNKTNGVSPRRFVRLANPRLSDLITQTIGDGWLTDLGRLRDLEPHADDPSFREAWRSVKAANKADLAEILRERTGVDLNPASIYDTLVKRLHEYKRQLLKVLHIIWLREQVKTGAAKDIEPRTFIFGAKAAPGYHMAKLIIKLINNLADSVNGDPELKGLLKVVFPANFNVSLAEHIYPAADISEQISLAGKEASGTGNMKFALNGAVTVGTLDGANVEIRELVGEENFFLFGLTTEEVEKTKASGYRSADHYEEDAELRRVIDSIADGEFSNGDRSLFRPIVDSLLGHDEYLLLADFRSYIECSERAAAAHRDTDSWSKMSVLNSARTGFFSSDRTIAQYCDEIWGAKPVRVS